MDKITEKHFIRARAEGRICSRCGWMIPKKEWNKGRRICWNCEDALKGVNTPQAWGKYLDEPPDMTGEML